ncbi:unnamed protein product, partial [Onchocerca flexuosa]|uniref:Protein kinase domain-containing protein n=1 Tax=Onchocerca flexuosa TaxID=387005 RepID=A0A183HNR3_9BILA
MLTGNDPPRDHEVNPFEKKIISLDGATLIQNMMEPNEERRISLGDILMSNFVRKVDGTSLPISRSRETSRDRDCQTAHISPAIVRAHSARLTASGCKRIIKDSAFESGESTHLYHRRPSLDYYCNESTGTNCRHNAYLANQCVHCGKCQSLERRCGRSKSSDVRRIEQRTTPTEPVGANLKQRKGN